MCRLVATVGLTALVACSDPVTPGPHAASLEIVAEGLESPVHVTAAPNDVERLFVVEQRGRIRVIRGGTLLGSPFLDITASTSYGGERGLLSVAFHPAFSTNGYLYVNSTDVNGDTRVVRYSVSADPDVADPSSALTILSVAQPFANHNGGQVAFGPDGMLYVGMGDGGSGGDPLGNGQDPAALLGSLLRLDVDREAPYAIPPDNPFVGHPTAAAETWVYGLRNPWRFSFDRQTGDLYIADVGQGAVEEISFQSAASAGGQNYGWNTREGSACFTPSSGCETEGLVIPVFEYSHAEGCSVTGGHVYRGTAAPTLAGRYFFADFCGTWVRSFRVNGGEAVDVMDHTVDFGPISQIVSFGEDALSELYIVSLDGTVYRMASQ